MRLEELRTQLRALQTRDEEIGRAPALDPLEEYIDCVLRVLRVPSKSMMTANPDLPRMTHPEISQEDARKYHG